MHAQYAERDKLRTCPALALLSPGGLRGFFAQCPSRLLLQESLSLPAPIGAAMNAIHEEPAHDAAVRRARNHDRQGSVAREDDSIFDAANRQDERDRNDYAQHEAAPVPLAVVGPDFGVGRDVLIERLAPFAQESFAAHRFHAAYFSGAILIDLLARERGFIERRFWMQRHQANAAR